MQIRVLNNLPLAVKWLSVELPLNTVTFSQVKGIDVHPHVFIVIQHRDPVFLFCVLE